MAETIAEAAVPRKVTAAELGFAEREAAEDAYEFDLGNLAAFNPHPLDAAAFQADRNAACQAEAARVFQALAARLFQLESEPAPVGRLACLPEPTTVLPREKPLPKPREPTKWELFAQRKGIQKRKRSALEWDDVTQEWRRRHGYKRAAGANDLPPVVEAGVGDQVGADPFAKQARDKKERKKKQEKQQLSNLKAAAKSGGKGALPPTLRLAAALPERGRGPRATKRGLHPELQSAARQAAVSTASMGKFDRMVSGERPEDRQPRGKKRRFLPVSDKQGSERQQQRNLVDKILRSNADDIIDVKQAIGKLESAAREQTHHMKMKGANKKGRLSKGAPGKAGGKRGPGSSGPQGKQGGGKRGAGSSGKPAGGKRGPAPSAKNAGRGGKTRR